MVSSEFACVICGVHPGLDGAEAWGFEFRGLYSGPEGLVLTGVGRYDPDDRALIAPRDHSARWDDPGYGRPPEDEFGAMRGDKVNGRYGFTFHDACWHLLERAARPLVLRHQRLFDILRSCKMPRHRAKSLCWGHDYGGFLGRSAKSLYPWVYKFWEAPGVLNPDIYHSHPTSIPELNQLLTQVPGEPPRPTSANSRWTNPTLTNTGRDPFGALPQELCDAIASFLSVKDALICRMASRGFYGLFNNQAFWATRFGSSFERSWFIEARDHPDPHTLDWRWLFRQTANHGSLPPAVLNRKRVWMLSQQISDMMFLESSTSLTTGEHQTRPTDTDTFIEEAAPVVWGRQVEAKVLYNGSHSLPLPCDNTCRRLFVQQHSLAGIDLAQLLVSTVRIGEDTFVAGIGIRDTAGGLVYLGYRSSWEEIVDLSSLTGLNLAVGPQGIRAVQCISHGHQHKWIGRPDNTPRSARLEDKSYGHQRGRLGQPDDLRRSARLADKNALEDASITALKVGFDRCKLVSMAISRRSRTLGHVQKELKSQDRKSLRTSVTWFPNVPDPTCDLNEKKFTAWPRYLPDSTTLLWTDFGGRQGSMLKHLVRVSGTTKGALKRLNFHYNDQETYPTRSSGYSNPAKTDGKTIDFPLDGPGGERITRIQVCKRQNGNKQWVTIGIKITTSRRRSCEFYHQYKDRASEKLKDASVASKTAIITGIYIYQWPGNLYNFDEVGVVSETPLSAETLSATGEEGV
ncbi:hypothetical protein GGR56DRAFT_660655 [Xylariaceae sp. FL0804]|nr:hypothetical protein GGR56DRAFT_660655 [Xylariaceae sp. FL0804]